MSKVFVAALVLLAILCVPAQAFAQLSIAGVAKDVSGAVLPGVSVEAGSPALIEKTRSVVTDANGQYQIVSLVPGTYTVTFTLTGFNTVKREGIVVSGNTFVANVNAEMGVGAVEETVNVTSESPVVDVQSVVQQQTMSSELMASIPAARQFFSQAQLVPGVTLSNMPSGLDVGGTSGVPQAAVLSHGSRIMDFRLMVDNLSVGTGGAGFTMWMPNPSQTDEISFVLSGGMGEAETSGSMVNMIPKSGGNRFTGSIVFSGTGGGLQGSNTDAELEALGFSNPNRIKRMYDFDPGFGGPIVRDHLWFYASYHDYNTQNWVANSYANLNAGKLNSWTYAPDLSQPSFLSDRYQAGSMRLTWQPTPRNKFAAYWDEQYRCESCAGPNAGGPGTSGVYVSSFRSPEATQVGHSWPDRVQQVTWSSPVNSHLLLQAGTGGQFERETTQPRTDGTANPLLISVIDQGGAYPGIIYRAPDELRNVWDGSLSWKASASYVTGTQNAKVGLFGQWNYHEGVPNRPQNVRYFFNDGLPFQLEQYAFPYESANTQILTGLYAQDSITLRKLTLQGSVRYDRVTTSWPAQSVGPTGFSTLGGAVPQFAIMPTQFSFPAGDGLKFNDITPRLSAAYDLRGDGKTALKFGLGKYMQIVGATLFPGYYALNPLDRLNFDTTRAWNDANHNFVPDCSLANPAGNGECGALANGNFGLSAPFSFSFDPDAVSGWGKRPFEWQMSAVVSQELLTRVSVDVGYYRTSFGNATVFENTVVSASDYNQFKITVPASPSLSNSGQTLTFLDVNPAKYGQVENQLRRASIFGDIAEHWQGVDINVNMRPRNGLTMQGGISAGSQSRDVCAVASKVPSIMFGLTTVGPGDEFGGGPVETALEYCKQSTGIQTQVKALASYTIPHIDLDVAGTFQSIPGSLLQAVSVTPNSVIAPSLGRDLAGGNAFAFLDLAQPGKQFGDTINQLDFRVAKRLSLHGTRLLVGVDLYNALNINTIQSYDTTYGPTYLNPLRIMPPRFLKFSAQLDF